MGAFIAYLHKEKGIRHFLVLAPNLTIYDKLIADFTPGTPKYVFQGLADFATQPPLVITGDNYEGGRGVRAEDRAEGLRQQVLPGMDTIHINIFNISKINSEGRGGAAPRIKRLAEYIGQSYFDYLSELPDLVLLDIKLPDMSGLEVLRVSKQESPHTKVIVMTGYVDQNIIDEAEQLGRDVFIQKPFNLVVLYDEIQKLLAQE